MAITEFGGRKRFTPAEVAVIKGVTADAVRKAIREKRLPAIDLNAGTGRKPRYRITLRALRESGRG
jgi:hypothetical protein